MYRVLSPDGFDISAVKRNYTLKEAKEAVKVFANNYQKQGYYSQICYNGYKREIPVNQIADYCEIVKEKGGQI